MQTLKVPEKLVVYTPQGCNYKFIIFGCGGTGAYLARDLAKIVGIYNQQYHRADDLLLLDGDVVEEHNLRRQNFITHDLGKNKAQVLAERYGSAFNVSMGFIPQYLRDNNSRSVMESLQGNCIPVYVSCVDNNKTRCMIHSMYRGTYGLNAIYIDSGNEEHAGQVVFSTTMGYTSNGYAMQFNSSNRPKIKDVVEEFELQPDDRHPDDLSCAEHAVHSPQNIATNMMAAQVIFNYCNTILCASAALSEVDRHNIIPFADAHKDARAVSAHVTYFNSRTGIITSHGFDSDTSACIEKYRSQREVWIEAERNKVIMTTAASA